MMAYGIRKHRTPATPAEVEAVRVLAEVVPVMNNIWPMLRNLAAAQARGEGALTSHQRAIVWGLVAQYRGRDARLRALRREQAE